MDSVNRSALIIRAKQPLVDWLNELPNLHPNEVFTINSANQEPPVFLVPEFHDPQNLFDELEQWKTSLFEYLLEGWCEDESLWPKERSAKVFNDWFELIWSSEVMDLAEGPIEKQTLLFAEE